MAYLPHLPSTEAVVVNNLRKKTNWSLLTKTALLGSLELGQVPAFEPFLAKLVS
jgi:hypothetical protein